MRKWALKFLIVFLPLFLVLHMSMAMLQINTVFITQPLKLQIEDDINHNESNFGMCECPNASRQQRIELTADIAQQAHKKFSYYRELGLVSFGTGGWKNGKPQLLQDLIVIQSLLRAWGTRPLFLHVYLIGPDIFSSREGAAEGKQDEQIACLRIAIEDFIHKNHLSSKHISIHGYVSHRDYLQDIGVNAKKAHILVGIDLLRFGGYGFSGMSDKEYAPNTISIPKGFYVISATDDALINAAVDPEMPITFHIYEDDNAQWMADKIIEQLKDPAYIKERWHDFLAKEAGHVDAMTRLPRFLHYLQTIFQAQYSFPLALQTNLMQAFKELILNGLEEVNLIYLLMWGQLYSPLHFSILIDSPAFKKSPMLPFNRWTDPFREYRK